MNTCIKEVTFFIFHNNFIRCLCKYFILFFDIFIEKVILLIQVAEWTDEGGFQTIAAKYVRLRPHTEIEKNKTYIVTTIMVS